MCVDHASNRLFLILIDQNDYFESWKLSELGPSWKRRLATISMLSAIELDVGSSLTGKAIGTTPSPISSS